MNKKRVLLFACWHLSLLYPASPLAESSQEQQLAQFFSVFPNPATTYPTFTALDQAVVQIFEKTLEVPPTLLGYLQQYYAYLKQQAAQECLAATPSPTNTKQSLAQSLQYAQEQLELAQHYNDTKDIQTWTTQLAQLSKEANQAITASVAADPITACRKTTSWQNHLKVFIANSFTYEVQLLGNINQDEIKMFSFLPNFETAYYANAYTNVRNSSEYTRMFLLVTDILRQRALTQCTDWSTINDPALLYEEIEAFKQGDFYRFSQKLDTCYNNTTTTALTQFVAPTGINTYTVPKGYAEYLTYTQDQTSKQYTIVAKQGFENLFSITNNLPSLTALGSFIFKEGTITPLKGTPYPGLIPTENFPKLFTENEMGPGTVPTPLFIELLSFNAVRILNSLLGYLFNTENLSDTLNRLNNLQTELAQSGTFSYALFPNPLFYYPEDQLFLQELNTLGTLTLGSTTTGGAQPEGFFSSLWDHIKDAFERLGHTLKKGFEKIGNDLWHVVKASGNFFVHLGYAVSDVAQGLYYQLGIANLVNVVTTGNLGSYQGGASYFDAAAGQIHDMGDDLSTIVNSVADVAEQVAGMANNIIATVCVSWYDQSLGDDIAGALDEVANLVVGLVADQADFLINVGASLVALAFEGVVLIEESVVGVLASALSGSNQFGDLQETGMYFAKDLVTSILEAVTLLVDIFADALKSLMQALAYITAALTEIVIQVGGAIMGLESLATGGSFWSGYHEVGEHARLINAVVGLVLMVALTAATLGGGSALEIGMGVAMLVMGVGMSALSVVGANQQDLAALSEQQNQVEFIQTYSAYIQASIPAQQSLQAQFFNEMTTRLQEDQDNADRDLVYYQNYMNSTLNTLRATNAYQISSFYDQLLTPDAINYPQQKIAPADLGYSYGIQTNRFELNPATGLRVYSDARQTFAQEIATIPLAYTNSVSGMQDQINTAFSNQTTANSTTATHFITQKDLSSFSQTDYQSVEDLSSFSQTDYQSVTVRVRWRILYYTGGDFYIGIYLNKNYLDTQFLHALHTSFESASQQRTINQQAFTNAWNVLNNFNRYVYNFDAYARAFMCYQNNTSNNMPTLGVYEHSDAQFIQSNQQPTAGPTGSPVTNWLQQGLWYMMQATLNENGTSLSVNFSQEDLKLTWNSTVTLSPVPEAFIIPYEKLYQAANYVSDNHYNGSFGIITSGAAVEYEILYPTPTITKSSARTTSDATVAQQLTSAGYQPIEIAREQSWLQQIKSQMQPTFGNFTLAPFSQLLLTQNIYAYQTTATNLKDSNNAPITDYLVTIANIPNSPTLVGTSAQLGQPFNQATSNCISLVSGVCYNAQNQAVITYPDALAAYQQTTGLPTALLLAINQSRNALFKAEAGTIRFQNTNVTGVLPTLQLGTGLYSCPSFTQYLTGLDYLVFINNNSNSGPGAAQLLEPLANNNTINAAFSMVTGLIYNLTTSNGTPINSLPAQNLNSITLTPSGSGAYRNPTNGYQIDNKTMAAIQNQTTAYTTAKNAAATPPPAPPAPSNPPPPAPAPVPGSPATLLGPDAPPIGVFGSEGFIG